MKRIVALSIIAMMIVMLGAPVAFGSTFKVETTSPKDDAEGMALDNLGIKITFSEEVYSEENEKINTKACKLIEIEETEEEDGTVTKKDGQEIPLLVVFDPKNKNSIMALADGSGDKAIKSNVEYRFELDESFVSADGDTLGESTVINFRTQNTSTTMGISVVMMVVMVVGMVFFTTRSQKKKAEKEEKEKSNPAGVNPYKEAKATGKSVEEIVAREAKKKAKEEEKKKRQAEENKVEIASDNIRVAKPRPISAAGATYKHPVKEKPAPKKAQSSNKKNQGNNKKPQNKKGGKKK